MTIDTKDLRAKAEEHRNKLGMRTEDLIRWHQDAHPEKVIDLIAAGERLFSSLDEALGLADTPEHAQDEEWQTRRKELGRICDEYVNFDAKPTTPPTSWKTAYYDLENERNKREHALTQQLAAVTAERDAAFAEADRLHAARETTSPNIKLVEFHNKTVDDLRAQLAAEVERSHRYIKALDEACARWLDLLPVADISDEQRAVECERIAELRKVGAK